MSLAADFGVTLTQHVLGNQAHHPGARGRFSALLTQIGVAGKLISAQVRRAGLIEVWGGTGETNVQGEKVQKLDRIANDTFVEVLRRSGCVAAMASEEEDALIPVEPELSGDYVVAFDPLDGSSNIDVSVSIGTIFAIYPRRHPDRVDLDDILRPGREMVGAGYIVYGSATVLVYSAGRTVDCFTLDPSSGEFFLTRRAIRMPARTKYLSINECNLPYWPDWVGPTLDEIKGRNDAETRRVSARHIGSLVADFHRNLLTGGLFMYPVDRRNGRGKLRLLYECNPLAWLAEIAGGAASWGGGRDPRPTASRTARPQRSDHRARRGRRVGRSHDGAARRPRAPLRSPAARTHGRDVTDGYTHCVIGRILRYGRQQSDRPLGSPAVLEGAGR